MAKIKIKIFKKKKIKLNFEKPDSYPFGKKITISKLDPAPKSPMKILFLYL